MPRNLPHPDRLNFEPFATRTTVAAVSENAVGCGFYMGLKALMIIAVG